MITTVYKVENREFDTIEEAKAYERQLQGYQFFRRKGEEAESFDRGDIVTFYSLGGIENIRQYLKKTFGVALCLCGTPLDPESDMEFPATYALLGLLEHKYIFISDEWIDDMHSILEDKRMRE